MPQYKPLPYGSREYAELRKTETRRSYRKTIDGRRCVIEHTRAARPGLWTFDGADLYSVETQGPPVSIFGAAASTWEVAGQGPTEAAAIAKAREKWTAAK